MFNINNLVQGWNRVYDIKKKRIIHAMKKDLEKTWKLRGQRFEVFRPKHENPKPSEWYIPLYALIHPGIMLGLDGPTATVSSKPGDKKKQSSARRLAKFGDLLWRRKPVVEEKERPDEGWVM